MSEPRVLEEWQHHVIQTPRGDRGRGGMAYCGVEVWSHEWHFLDADHARRSVEQGDRLQPCPACWAALLLAVPVPLGVRIQVATLVPGITTLTADLYHRQDSVLLPDGTVEIQCEGGICVVRPNGHRVMDVRMLKAVAEMTGSGAAAV